MNVLGVCGGFYDINIYRRSSGRRTIRDDRANSIGVLLLILYSNQPSVGENRESNNGGEGTALR